MTDTIRFNRTSNIFVNTGIVGFYRFLKKYKQRHADKYDFELPKLEPDGLTLKCDRLIELLEDVYYFMGRELYDTWTAKQKGEADKGKANFYYDVEKDEFVSFPKMVTYGLTALFTNNAQGTTRLEENTSKIKKLDKEQPELAGKIRSYFESQGVKIASKVYFNEPYTKITRLGTKPPHLAEGKLNCPILNEGFKMLVGDKNISPFVSGMENFNSYLGSNRKVSWKAAYMIRFSPALILYTHQNSYERLVCNVFNSSNLCHIDLLNGEENLEDKEVLRTTNFRQNVKLVSFSYQKKNDEHYNVDTSRDIASLSELSFILIYGFYLRQFRKNLESPAEEMEDDPFADSPLENMPISLVSFQSEKFAATMRPNMYEEYNNIKFLIRLMHECEKNGVPIKDIWQGLKIFTPKTSALKDYNKRMAAERSIRINVLGSVLKGGTILNAYEKLYYDTYTLMIGKETSGYRNYYTLLKFLTIYERKIKFGNNMAMTETLQDATIKLGYQIGKAILSFEGNSSAENVKGSRKYIVKLRKARTQKQFLDAFISLQTKYQLGFIPVNEFLKKIREENFYQVKQYLLISVLNNLNTSSFNSKKGTNESK